MASALPQTTRRQLIGGAMLAGVAGVAGCATTAQRSLSAAALEGQRQADQGDGHYINPILAGDRPDPTVLKDGADYYLTTSSFEANPGLLIWHSRDLVNWQPLASALTTYLGSVWAPELVKHSGRYYLYVPTKHPRGNDIHVLVADDIRGPWSTPVALGIDLIDPGHAADAQGRRFLFLSGGWRVRLSDDGLRTTGPLHKVHEGWVYPEDWDVESHSQEGPKMTWHGGWWHMTLALGVVAGDRACRIEVDVEWDAGAQAGLLLFYNDRLYAGLGVDARGFILHRYGKDQRRGTHEAGNPGQLRLRLTLRDHILTLHHSRDGGASWRKYGTQMEVSGYHHNVAGGFMSLRPAIYAAGGGAVRFRRLRYAALN